jgi:hypothetical protein
MNAEREATLAITVGVVTYQRARYIAHSLESVKTQTPLPAEVVIVDDGSTDATAAVVAPFCDDPRVRYVPVRHGGVARARNALLAEARGAFILWLDSDDLLLPGVLGLYRGFLAAHQHADVLYGDQILIDEDGRDVGRRDFRNYTEAELVPALFRGCAIPHPCTLVRKRCYDHVGRYNEDLEYAEDNDFFARSAASFEFHHVGRPVCRYRTHGAQLCGLAERSDRRCEHSVMESMVSRYGVEALYPSICDSLPSIRIARCSMLAAMEFHERGGYEQRDRLFERASSMVLATPTPQRSGAGEALLLLSTLKRSNADTYMRYARTCSQVWPRVPKIWLHVCFALARQALRRPVLAR